MALTQHGLPLDSIQRQAVEEGVANLQDSEAEEIANDLEVALRELPQAVTELEAALAESSAHEDDGSPLRTGDQEPKIAVLFEDDESLSKQVRDVLEPIDFAVRRPRHIDHVLDSSQPALPSLVLVDVTMPNVDGFELLRRLKAELPSTLAVAITGNEELGRVAARCKSIGATFLQKHLPPNELAILLQGFAELAELENAPADELVGFSPSMQAVRRSAERLADAATPLLIAGEGGTGKDLIARKIHQHSSRRARPFIAVNCAALPEELLEVELWGNVRGALAGALSARPGLFAAADGGTIYLADPEELPAGLQTKLLRVLRTSEVASLGATTTKKLDIRVLLSTSRDLNELVRVGRLREDFRDEVSEHQIHIPPLRDRGNDVVVLAHWMLQQAVREYRSQAIGFAPEAITAMRQDRWPGNVRQLRNCVFQAALLSQESVITEADLLLSEKPILPLAEALESYERQYIMDALSRADGNKSKAATMLRLTHSAFEQRLSRLLSTGMSGKVVR
ncbi:MAG: sigma-54 dependent transcriptional regulator [Polyangiaceae bacterium]